MECCASSCCCYCCHCHCHPHHHCHGTTVLPSNNNQRHQQKSSLNRLIAAKRLPELPSSKHQTLAPESSQSLSSPDDIREDPKHHHKQQQQQRHLHLRPSHQQQRRYHHNQCSRLPEKIPSGGTIAIEIDAATLTDDISYCSSISNNSFALAMANETTNSKDILVHCSGGGGGDDNHVPPRDHHRRKSRSRAAHHCHSHIDSVCSTTSTTEDEVVIVQRKCKRSKFIARQDTIDGAADVEEDDDDGKLTKAKPVMATTCCDAANCCTTVNEGVKIKRKNFTNRYYCSSCSKCSSCSCCQQELEDGQLHNSCSFSSSLSHIEDDGDRVGHEDDDFCSRCDAKANGNGGDDSGDDDAAGDSSQQSAESFCSCNSTSRCYCSCSCDESDTIRKESSTTTPATMSDVSTPVETPYGTGGGSGIASSNFAEDAFSMAGKSSVSQSEYFSLSSDKPPSHSLASSPMSPLPLPPPQPATDSVMPSPPALPRKHCKHYSKHHRHKSDGNFDTVL